MLLQGRPSLRGYDAIGVGINEGLALQIDPLKFVTVIFRSWQNGHDCLFSRVQSDA